MIVTINKGMLTLESSSYVLEIPNNAYTTLSKILIDSSTLSQELQADWLILENNEKATSNMPYI